jgi:phosphatidylinositol glycan class B
MAARTLSNSMEMVFTAIALNYWPLPGVVRLEKDWLANYRIALLFALVACVMRPTNGLIWLFLGIQLWFTAKGNRLTVLLNAIVAWYIYYFVYFSVQKTIKLFFLVSLWLLLMQ